PLLEEAGRAGGARLGPRGAGPLLDPRGQLLHLVVDPAALRHLLADLLVRVHHRGVVPAAEVLPIFGSDESVSSRHRYMAICRACASALVLPGPHRSSMVTPKNSAVTAMIVGGVISGVWESGIRSRSTISASCRSTGCRFKEANAVTRISAPSSSRMLRSIRDAMNSSTSAGAFNRSCAAFLRRMAIRVS